MTERKTITVDVETLEKHIEFMENAQELYGENENFKSQIEAYRKILKGDFTLTEI